MLLARLKWHLITTHQQRTQKMVCAACKGHPQHNGFHMPLHVPCPWLENIRLFATGGKIRRSKKGEVGNAANKFTSLHISKVGTAHFLTVSWSASQTAASLRKCVIYETLSTSRSCKGSPLATAQQGPGYHCWLTVLSLLAISSATTREYMLSFTLKTPVLRGAECLVWEAALREAARGWMAQPLYAPFFLRGLNQILSW